MTTVSQINGSQPVFTDGAASTQAAIQLPYDIGNHADDMGAYYCEFTQFYGSETGVWTSNRSLISDYVSNNQVAYTRGANHVRTYDSVSETSSALKTYQAGVPMKVGIAYDATEGQKSANLDGDYGVDGTYDGTYNMQVSLNLLYGTSVPQLIRNVRRYSLPYTEAKQKIDDLMSL